MKKSAVGGPAGALFPHFVKGYLLEVTSLVIHYHKLFGAVDFLCEEDMTAIGRPAGGFTISPSVGELSVVGTVRFYRADLENTIYFRGEDNFIVVR